MKTMMPFRFLAILALIIILISKPCASQECSSTIILKLNNMNGGVYSGLKITLTSRLDGKTYLQNSNNLGEATFQVPCNAIYDVSIPNYTKKIEIQTHDGGQSKRTLTYEPNMAAKDILFAMSEEEKGKVDLTAMQLSDSMTIKDSKMIAPKNLEHFVEVNIEISDFSNHPIGDELIIFNGIKRNKKFIGRTDNNGKLKVFVPKGDTYTLSFRYHKNYSTNEYKYTKGSASDELRLSYLGTKEIERRKKEETIRIAELEKRLKEEREKFELECKKRKISLEEGYKLEWEKLREDYMPNDSVILSVLRRNNWPEKLIVCDITGSMQPYAAQLSVWYQLNYKKEKNLQFVFFNDGDQKNDSEKVIGETGGIYYSPSKGIDSLGRLISYVSSKGDGGDCAENNMEALIKGTKMAKNYKEIVAIVDNNSPVKDIRLLDSFNKPVHIILCGAIEGWVLPDYLLIAWKTKGTIHTIEEDITSIAKMSEGQEVKIGKITYKIMGGEFVRITNI